MVALRCTGAGACMEISHSDVDGWGEFLIHQELPRDMTGMGNNILPRYYESIGNRCGFADTGPEQINQ